MILQVLLRLAIAIAGVLWLWRSAMQALGDQPWPQLPPTPTPVNIPFPSIPPVNQQPLTPDKEQIAQELSKEFGGSISIDDIRDIIRNNPGLTKDQYRLLAERYRRTGQMPRNVLGVVGIGTNSKGNVSKIFFVTQGDITHIRQSHYDDFKNLTDEELTNLLMQTLENDTPVDVEHDTKSDVYYYDPVLIDGFYEELAIVVSKTNSGRIITSYIIH